MELTQSWQEYSITADSYMQSANAMQELEELERREVQRQENEERYRVLTLANSRGYLRKRRYSYRQIGMLDVHRKRRQHGGRIYNY